MAMLIKPISEPTPVEVPQNMDDLLGKAHNDWKFKRKDECIMKLLSAIAMLSTGVAGCMKTANQALQISVETHDFVHADKLPNDVDDQNLKEFTEGKQ